MNARIVLVGSALAGWTLLTMLDAAAKVGVLLALAVLAALCMGRASAASRHLVWLCALAGALVLPFGFRLLPQWQVLPSWMRWEEAPRLLSARNPVPVQVAEPEHAFGERIAVAVDSAEYELPEIPGSASGEKAARMEPPILHVPARWFIGVWAAGCFALVLPMAISSLSLRRKAALGRRVEAGALFETLELLKSELGLRRKVRLLMGDPADMPMAWGISRHHLLLPAGAENWAPQRLRAVLLHELSHLRRNDPLALWIGHAALALHWFNPLAWWAIRQMRMEQEGACDDAVLRHGVLSSDYAGEVLEISSAFPKERAAPFMALTMARHSGIENRIAGILDASRNRRSVTRRLAIGFSTLTALAAFSLAILRASDAPTMLRGRILDRNGVVLAESTDAGTRNYPFGASAAHRLGLAIQSGKGSADSGRSGAEKLFETRLASGEDVAITLDHGIQQALESAMEEAGVKKGAAVILDCGNGDLLADASFPAYDPNHLRLYDRHQRRLEISPEVFRFLRENPATPMADRVVSRFTPGSTYKLVAALAACRAGKSAAVLDCDGSVAFGNAKVHCWIHNRDGGSHGPLDLRGGISRSCNCYHTQLAVLTGSEAWDVTEEALGLEAMTVRQRKMGGITPHGMAMTSLGQGAVRVSPLQLAVVAAAIGNGGKVWAPRLSLDEVPRFRADLLEQGWKAEDLAIIRAGMWDCVNAAEGTGQRTRSEIVGIAGKTGTAQTADAKGKSTDAWFIGYAPAENPRYAIAILAEGEKSGGAFCGPIARRVFEAICGD